MTVDVLFTNNTYMWLFIVDNYQVHTNVRDVRDVMSGMYGVVVRCTQYLCRYWSEFYKLGIIGKLKLHSQ